MKLVIVGQKGWLSDEIYKLPKKLGIEERVRFLGYVAEKDLPALYSGALALTFPSLFEGFGLPILEAMAAGVLVVTTKCAAIPEVGGESVFYFDSTDYHDLARQIESVLGLPVEEKKRIAEKAKKRVLQFSWEHAAEKVVSCFKQTISSN